MCINVYDDNTGILNILNIVCGSKISFQVHAMKCLMPM